MARPKKIGLEYFPLDCSFDDSMQFVEAKHGMEGFAVVIKLWQKIYKFEGYYTPWQEKNEYLFAKETGIELDVIKGIVSTCFGEGIFHRGMFTRHYILTSSGIQERWLRVITDAKRKGVEINPAFSLLGVSSEKTGVNSEETPENSEETPVNSGILPVESTQSKVKESTGKESIEEETKVEYSLPSVEGLSFENPGIKVVQEYTNLAENTPLTDPNYQAPHTGGGGEVEPNYHKMFTDAYCDFYEQRVGVRPDFTKADGVAAAGLRKFLKDNCREKSEEGALNSLHYIFQNWDKLEPFYQDQLKLSQIRSNINNIMNQVKNGTAKKQSTIEGKPNGAKPSFAGVAAIVDYMSDKGRFV